MPSLLKRPRVRLYAPAVLLGLLAQLETWFGSEFPDDALHAPMYAVSCAALALRRRHPLLTVLLTNAPLVVLTARNETDFAAAQLIAMVLAIVSLAEWAPNRTFAAGFAIAFSVSVANGLSEGKSDLGDVVFPLLLLGLPAIIGRTTRAWRTQAEELGRLAKELEQEREERARLAVVEERGRIAREMHDVVAHSLGVIVVQAGGARLQLDDEPEETRRALEVIEQTGRQSLSEIRGLLGRLRDDDEMALAPAPGLAQLEQLVARASDAGLKVGLRVEGSPRPLPPGVDLSAYRIVQEALTNAIKHAGPAEATVVLRYGAHDVTIEIADDGSGEGAPDLPSGGHGLVGMRERVALHGGEIAAGPRAGRGYSVSARLPVPA
jgi:signal transduction histidine kinase